MGELTKLTGLVYRQLTERAKASEQGGVITGLNPVLYNAGDPFPLWVIQVVIILGIAQIVALILGRLRQPRVVSEIIGGVILGPTAMGRIPGFTTTIFPTASLPMLTLTSTIGLVFFLFLVALELDIRVLKRNLANSAAVAVAGLAIPLSIGAALGVGVYHQFISPEVNFGYFLLFVAVAVGITAFPVLCRILTELKILDTNVGMVALSAGVGNDIVGWILLVLTVALINSSSGLSALWVLLSCTGFTIFLLYPVRWGYVWLARRTGSLERGSPTTLLMTVTLFIVLVCALFTDIIGVQAIFGGFLAGLIIPHENGFAISLVERLEDLVSILFMPIYFTLSGLKTNLGLLNNGITWGYTILICVTSFSAKFLACGISAKLTGYNWRESGAVGSLMACKGLVELIVLNIGLQAGYLDTRVFSMFVIHAIILTIMTTPLVLLFYPPKHRTLEHSDTASRVSGADLDSKLAADGEYLYKSRITIALDRFEQLPAAMTITQLLRPYTSPVSSVEKTINDTTALVPPAMNLDALRLMELSGRTSAVLRSTESEALLLEDPLITVFKTFGHLNSIPVFSSISVVNYDEYPTAIAEHAERSASQMIIVPWSSGHHLTVQDTKTEVHNPFESIFHRSTTSQDTTSSIVYSEYVRRVFHHSPVDIALYVDRVPSLKTSAKPVRHLLLPFFGGPDDRLALAFVIQLCMNKDASATVLRLNKVDPLSPLVTNATAVDPPKSGPQHPTLIHQTMAAADTHYGEVTPQHRMVSDTADNLLWDKYAQRDGLNSFELDALSRIDFVTKSTPGFLHSVEEEANHLLTQNKELIVVLGRSRRMATESHAAELREIIAERGSSIGTSVAKTLGDVGASLVVMDVHASLLVMQAHSGSR